jgi:hypothetical protein
MPNYDYETVVPQGGNYKEQAPRKEGFTTYVNGTVDVTTPGEYVITYTHLKPEPFESITESRLVTVSDAGSLDDSPEPIVYLYGDSVETIIQGQEFVDPGAYALSRPNELSSEGSNLAVKTVSSVEENSWSSQPTGNYSILYYAVSNSKRIGFATRTVIIEAGPTLLELYGCPRLYVEYPEDGTVPIYAGVDYAESGSHITKDAGYNIEGTDYDLKIFVQRESGGESFSVSPDNVFFNGEAYVSETYQIYYSVTTSAGVQKLAIREVTMIKPGETDQSILSGLELQKNSLNGCSNTQPISTEDNEYDDLLDELGDAINDDPDLTVEDLPEPVNNTNLVVLCAGKTAFSGGIFPSTWNSNPGKIPETIIETLYKPANPKGWDLMWKTKTGIVLPGDSQQTEWFGEKGSIPWRLYKVHSETKVTYSYGMSAGVMYFRNPSTDIIFSTFEPYYDAQGNRIGDIFYGFYGAHIFTEEYGWTTNLTKNSSTLRESFDGRHYWGKSASSVTRVTQELKDHHMDVISGDNVYTDDGQPLRVLKDPNSTTTDRGIIFNSHPLWYAFQKNIIRRDTGTVAGEDVINLRWFGLSGGRDVSAYCIAPDPSSEPPSLPLFCNTTRDPYLGFDGTNNAGSSEYIPNGVIPGCLVELTWTDNPDYNTSHPNSVSNYSNISPDFDKFSAEWDDHVYWFLKEIYEDRVLYINNNGEQRFVTIDPNDSTMNKFAGLKGTYTWNHWSVGHLGGSTWGLKYVSNFKSGNRIIENSPHSSLDNLPAGQNYYKSLAVWDRSSSGNTWANPQVNPNQEVPVYPLISGNLDYSAFGIFNSCTPKPPSLPLFCNTTIDPYEGFDGTNSFTYTPGGTVPACLVELTWTDNPYKGLSPYSHFMKYSNISMETHYLKLHNDIEHVWLLEEIYEDRVLYISKNGEQRYLTIDPEDPTMNKFVAGRGTYTWNRWSMAIYGDSLYGHKYMTNFETDTRILEDNIDNSLRNLTYSGAHQGQQYYKSLLAWDRTGLGWADPQNNPSKTLGTYPMGALLYNTPHTYSVEETINQCS